MARVAVRILRPCHLAGEPVAAGVIVQADALDAAALVSAGRGELVRPAEDAARVREAVHADVLRTMRRLGQAGHGRAPSYWQPVAG